MGAEVPAVVCRARRAGVVIALAVAMSGGCATSIFGTGPARFEDGVLVTPEGMVLYTFDRDRGARTRAGIASACVAECAAQWPPFEAAEDARPTGDFTIFERGDGTLQWAYKGGPLYRSRGDTRPGERSGEGVDNLWRAARP